MSKKDSLGDRLKQYETASKTYLTRRLPVILRVDGKSFHSYVKGCKKPFDQGLYDVMNLTAIELCKQIQGAQIGYCQSDEISILINNYKELNTSAWFDNNLQKMVSISAAIASTTFTSNSWRIWAPENASNKQEFNKTALFDSRAFVLPKEEVNNAFLWRQIDNTRNSVQMLSRSLYSHKELNNKNTIQLKEMCLQKGKSWEDLPIHQQRGRCIVKETYTKDGVVRTRWVVDENIPIFSKDTHYINKYI